jgi:hypothetical protein
MFSWTRVTRSDSRSPISDYTCFPRPIISLSSLKCQVHYLPNQRAIVSFSGETLFTITLEIINQMLQIPRDDSASPFSIKILIELYKKLSFPQRAHIFKIFLPKYAQLPINNPPYPSSIFSVKGNQMISSLCFLLGYYSDEWVDEPILGFLSIFSTEEKAITQFDYNQFLADIIHEHLFKLLTEVMFRYSSVLVYLFLFFQVDKFSFSLQKLDQDKNPQPMTSWT